MLMCCRVDKVEVGFSEAMPLQDYFQIIDSHFEARYGDVLVVL